MDGYRAALKSRTATGWPTYPFNADSYSGYCSIHERIDHYRLIAVREISLDVASHGDHDRLELLDQCLRDVVL